MSKLIKRTSENYKLYVSDITLLKSLAKIVSKFPNEGLCDKPLIKENHYLD